MPTLTDGLSVNDGALIRVRFGLSEDDVQRRRRTRSVIPQPRECVALIDTGAQISCFDPGILRPLNLSVTSGKLVNAPGLTGVQPTVLTEVRVALLHPGSDPTWAFEIPFLEIAELDIGALNYEAVLGRDVLSLLTLTYDGPQDTYTLSYSP